MAQPQNPTVALPYEQFARQQLAQEMAKLADNPLDQTKPGGVYVGTDGEKHDAEGKPLKGEEKPLKGGDFDVSKASREELEAEAESRGLTVEGSGSDGYVTMEDLRGALG